MNEDDDEVLMEEDDELALKFQDEHNLSLVETGGVIISDISAKPEEVKVNAPRKRKQPSKDTKTPRKNPPDKLARIQKAHARITNKAAAKIAEDAFDLYADSTLKDAREEALRGDIECRDALRKIRAIVRDTESAPPLLTEHAKLVKKIKKASSNRDELLIEAAATLEKIGRELRGFEEKFESLAEAFGKNSARCLATATTSSTVTRMPSSQLLASSDQEGIVALVSKDKKKLALIDEYQHPRFALVVGSDGSAAIGVNSRPGRLVPQGKPGADYMAFSIARSQLVPTSKAAARATNRVVASNRVAVRKAQTESYVRTQLAVENTMTKEKLLAIPAPKPQALLTAGDEDD